MSDYRVNFYKTLLSSQGHSFKRLQKEIEVQSDTPSGALTLAQSRLGPGFEPDCIEVIRAGRSSGFSETLDERRRQMQAS